MAAKVLTLPEPKRPSEVDMVEDTNYFPYHRLISHPIEDCYVLKDKIEEMINKGDERVDHVRTDENLADPLTKGLAREKVYNTSVKMRLMPI